METFLAIASRRDERKYLPQTLPAGVVARLLDAGRLSGSSRNAQPWTFAVPESRERVERIAASVFVPENVLSAGAVIAILVRGKGPVLFDAGRAAQSMLLAAWAAGIASCPNGIADADAARGRPRCRGRRGTRDRAVLRAARPRTRSRESDGRCLERARESQDDRRGGAAAQMMKGGLDLGGTKIQAVVTDVTATVLGQARRDTPRTGGPEAIVSELAEAMGAALDDAGVELMGISGIGIGAPGSIDAEAGIVLQVANIEGLESPFPLGPALAEELGRPVALGNDVSVAVEAERRYGRGSWRVAPSSASSGGPAWGVGSSSTGACSTGVGRRGEVGDASAQNPVGDAATVACVAVSRHTLAAVRSRSAPGRAGSARRCCSSLLSGKRVVTSSRAGFGFGRSRHTMRSPRLIERAVQALGVGIGSAVTLLDVEAVVIGAGLVNGSGRSGWRGSSRRLGSTRSSARRPRTASPSSATSAARSAQA